MSLPVNIEELLHGQVIENERIEYKEGWNPEKVLHTICAFANDFSNLGGGYIVIGIAEKDGQPIFPPKGVSKSETVKIQKDLLNLSHKIVPNYFPVSETLLYQGKTIQIIWVAGGQNRPYKAPASLAPKSEYAYYIRRYSSTIKANPSELKELMTLSNNIPFDDRLNHSKKVEEISGFLIQEFLHEIKSSLSKEAPKLSIKELCQRMNIADGSKENIRPKNIGLLLFNENPEKIFPGAQIDFVEFEDEVGDKFTEKVFTGPVHKQLNEALLYFKNSIVKEFVHKIPGRAEAERYYNYPYEAFKEALVNAVYHKSYEEREPVEVRVYRDRIAILSYPGPMPPLSKDNINNATVASRRYRNRRIGDFLKELHLAEGRSTGFPKIREALKNNGSPEPLFETDNDREYFQVTIRIHSKAKKSIIEKKTGTRLVERLVEGLVENQRKLLWLMSVNPSVSKRELAGKIKISTTAIDKSITALKKKGLLRRVGPDKGGHWEVTEAALKKIKVMIKK